MDFDTPTQKCLGSVSGSGLTGKRLEIKQANNINTCFKYVKSIFGEFYYSITAQHKMLAVQF